MNKFPFICEIRSGYRNSEPHDQNDEIGSPLNL